jgi:hypothetical protein
LRGRGTLTIKSIGAADLRCRGIKRVSLVLTLLALATSAAHATNYPRSGKKGGVNHCQGSTFICTDGSVSASKKNCSSVMGTVGLVSPQEMQPKRARIARAIQVNTASVHVAYTFATG